MAGAAKLLALYIDALEVITGGRALQNLISADILGPLSINSIEVITAGRALQNLISADILGPLSINSVEVITGGRVLRNVTMESELLITVIGQAINLQSDGPAQVYQRFQNSASLGFVGLAGPLGSEIIAGGLPNALVLNMNSAFPVQFATTGLVRHTITPDGVTILGSGADVGSATPGGIRATGASQFDGGIASKRGSTGVTSTPTTLFSFTTLGIIIVAASVNSGNVQGWAVYSYNGATLTLLRSDTGGSLTFSASGTSVQLAQTLGGTQVVFWNYTTLNL